MTSLENIKLSTDQLASFLGVAVPRLNAWRHAGLLPHISSGRGYPAEYRMAQILSAWLCCVLVDMGAKASDAASVASHVAIVPQIVCVKIGQRAVVEVMFRNGRPVLAHDPLTDPKVVIPLEPVFQRLIPVLGAELAAHRGEEAGQAAQDAFWQTVAEARRRHQFQETVGAAIVDAIKNE